MFDSFAQVFVNTFLFNQHFGRRDISIDKACTCKLHLILQLERDNISFRLNSGRKQYVEKGGKLGRPAGSTKSQDKKREEYREVINLLNKGYAIRDVAKLTGKGISTVQRVKKEFVA